MRENLVGYLLDALDPADRELMEVQLTRDPQLQQELQHVSRLLTPLDADREHCDCPVDLARRTCQFVASQVNATLAPAPARGSWSFSDMAMAAGIFLAATMLFFPALNQSRFAARVTGCQNNLGQIGVALANYSTIHRGYFPNIVADRRAASAGLYAVKLFEHGYLKDPHILICPASSLAVEAHQFQVPSQQHLAIVNEVELPAVQGRMGGSYGYNLGYLSNGRYQAPKNLGRARFAIMADMPSPTATHSSLNHNGHGQNVLFEDAHVQYLTTCKARGCTDDIYVNDDGDVSAGLHMHDSVIGASHAKPVAPQRMKELLRDE